MQAILKEMQVKWSLHTLRPGTQIGHRSLDGRHLSPQSRATAPVKRPRLVSSVPGACGCFFSSVKEPQKGQKCIGEISLMRTKLRRVWCKWERWARKQLSFAGRHGTAVTSPRLHKKLSILVHAADYQSSRHPPWGASGTHHKLARGELYRFTIRTVPFVI